MRSVHGNALSDFSFATIFTPFRARAIVGPHNKAPNDDYKWANVPLTAGELQLEAA